jgi:DNA-binding SARP family transcriptional activator
MAAEFHLLGEIEVLVDGQQVDIGHARQRCVLAVLLVEANRLVSTGQLVERVWGDEQSPRARNTLYGYVHRLRGALTGAADLRRKHGGYVLEVDPSTVDLHRFRALVAEARAGADGRALLSEALGLWRGEPFGGAESPWLAAQRSRLELDRLDARLAHHDLALRDGRHAEVLPDLSALADTYPMDERIAGQLMLALHRSGRSAAAFDHFHRLRRRLADELGVDPGPELRQVYQRMLANDRESAGSGASWPAAAPDSAESAVTRPAAGLEPAEPGPAVAPELAERGVVRSAAGSGSADQGVVRPAADPESAESGATRSASASETAAGAEVAAEPPAAPETSAPLAEAQRPSLRRGAVIGVLALVVVIAAGIVGARLLLGGNDPDDDGPATASSVPNPGRPAAGGYDFRLAHSKLCLTEQPDNGSGRVFQADCATSMPARALQPLRSDIYRIATNHPDFGPGCTGIPNAAMEPGAQVVDDWCGGGAAEEFRVEAMAAGYRIRAVHSDLCLGVLNASKEEWAPVFQLPCDSTGAGQVFELVPKT